MSYKPSGQIGQIGSGLRLGTRVRIIGGPTLALGRTGVITASSPRTIRLPDGERSRSVYWPVLLSGPPLSNGGNGYLVREDEVEVIG